MLIPQEQHPDINFVGLLIGPRGNTLKAMEKDTGAKIIIRGKGSVKEGKVGRKDGQPLPGEDEPLHAFITAANPECVKKAVERINEVITQGIDVPEGHNDLRRNQLRELALLNGKHSRTTTSRDPNIVNIHFYCLQAHCVKLTVHVATIAAQRTTRAGCVPTNRTSPITLCAHRAVELVTLPKIARASDLVRAVRQTTIPKRKSTKST